jgi:hypothetical protein
MSTRYFTQSVFVAGCNTARMFTGVTCDHVPQQFDKPFRRLFNHLAGQLDDQGARLTSSPALNASRTLRSFPGGLRFSPLIMRALSCVSDSLRVSLSNASCPKAPGASLSTVADTCCHTIEPISGIQAHIVMPSFATHQDASTSSEVCEAISLCCNRSKIAKDSSS